MESKQRPNRGTFTETLSTSIRSSIRTGTALALMSIPLAVLARDDGRYAQSELKTWFDGLESQKGNCCSMADGQATEFEIRGNHYYAPINGVMREVPDEAVIHGPNLVGVAMKWIMIGSEGEKEFRCFLPGPGS
jgi:hypothetical protein